MIYFILEPELDRVKIGHTIGKSIKKVAKRRNELEVGNSQTLLIIGIMPGEKGTEDKYHTNFHKTYIKGEWFQMSEILENFITENRMDLDYDTLNTKTNSYRDTTQRCYCAIEGCNSPQMNTKATDQTPAYRNVCSKHWGRGRGAKRERTT